MSKLTLLLLILIPAAVSRAEAQDGVPLDTERVYTAGERIASPWTGISFVVPSDMKAQYDADMSAVGMQSSEMMMAVFGASEAAPEDLGQAAIEVLEEHGIRLNPTELDQPDAQTIRGTYTAATEEGIGLTVAAARKGLQDNAVAVFTLGRPGQDEALRAAVDEILDSIVWSEPTATEWRSRVAGRRFSTSGTSSTYSPGGAGGSGSHASGTESALDLCSGGTYAFETRSESYISIEGASAERVSSDAHAGRWRLVSDLAGTAYLVLEAGDGRSFTWLVEETPDGAAIDGTTYAVSPGGRCR